MCSHILKVQFDKFDLCLHQNQDRPPTISLCPTYSSLPFLSTSLHPFPIPIQNLCVTVTFQWPNSQSSQRAWWAASPSSEVPVLFLVTSLAGRIKERSGWYNKPFRFPLWGYAFALRLDAHWFRNWWPLDASKCQVSD